MSDDSVIQGGAPVISVPENLTAKGAGKKRGKSKKHNKKKPHHTAKKISKFFKGIGKGIKSVVKAVEKPVNKVANRLLFVADDFTGYTGKDSMVKQPTTPTSAAGDGEGSNLLMWGALIGGGVLVYFIIRETM